MKFSQTWKSLLYRRFRWSVLYDGTLGDFLQDLPKAYVSQVLYDGFDYMEIVGNVLIVAYCT